MLMLQYSPILLITMKSCHYYDCFQNDLNVSVKHTEKYLIAFFMYGIQNWQACLSSVTLLDLNLIISFLPKSNFNRSQDIERLSFCQSGTNVEPIVAILLVYSWYIVALSRHLCMRWRRQEIGKNFLSRFKKIGG